MPPCADPPSYIFVRSVVCSTFVFADPEEAVAGLSVNNPIAMGSACGTPEFTNYTSGFSGCLDYIFYQRSKFQVDQVIPLPSLEEVTQHTALPSIVFPSDHIALIADLKWI